MPGGWNDIHRPGRKEVRTLVLSHPEYLTREQQHHHSAFAKHGASAFSFGGRWQRFAGGAGGS